ncbi:cation:proton antiporter [Catellatospora bangladeshensis]|uniref:Sodium/hydrogen exchanger n=2 Tax=Catellatospora bangladeshensis TaxID=310355 RepID=A0A8J3NJ06_9ACTN|nr:cation:proton antiporter [Catellatospora bangladeshensis]GIF80966.1 sodium/hydrogen exchanger [Catellatospora bangladeshensis]
MLAVLMLGVVLVAWAVVSRRAQRYSVTVPIAMAASGLILTSGSHPLVDVEVTGPVVRHLVELTLAFVLFTDATDISMRWLKEQRGVPIRMLLIAFPLTVLLGFLAGVPLLPGAGWWVCAIIGAVLAATDSTPILPMLHDDRLPAGTRHTITVVSGLDDGLAAPLVLLMLAGALATVDVQSVLIELLIALIAGVVVGVGGAKLITMARHLRWSTVEAERVGVLALAITAFSAAEVLHGNGFVAAFVAGIATRATAPGMPRSSLQTVEDFSTVLSAAVWFVFGSLIVPAFMDGLEWRVFVYAFLSLTLIRMLPVALSLLGTHLPWRERWALGFWGPRGLDSMVLGIIALEQLSGLDADWVADVVVVVISLSILVHGLSARYFARWWLHGPRTRRHPPREPAADVS